jgi:hypothetical protein
MPVNAVFSAGIFQQMDNYLFEHGETTLRVNGLPGSVVFNLFNAPGSFEDNIIKRQLANHHFANAFELLNAFYRNVNLQEIDTAAIDPDTAYYYIEVDLRSLPLPAEKTLLKSIPHSFFITLCNINDDTNNDFRIAHNNTAMIDYVRGFAGAAYLNETDVRTELQQLAIESLEKALLAFCASNHIAIPGYSTAQLQKHLTATATPADYKEWLKIIHPALKKTVAEKTAAAIMEMKNQEGEQDFSFELYSMLGNDAGGEHLFWHSDWKFSPEDAVHFISLMLDKQFHFSHPPDAYSSNLFPYLQKALAKENKVLLSFDTQGDIYLFFLINKKDSKKFIELSDKIGIALEILD